MGFADTFAEASTMENYKMAPEYRTPSPTREIDFDMDNQYSGESERHVPTQQFVSNTNVLENPTTPRANRILLDWHGLPSRRHQASRMKLRSRRATRRMTSQNSSVFSGRLGHDRTSPEVGVEKETPTYNVSAIQLMESSQSDEQTRGSCPMSLERSSVASEDIEYDTSSLSSPGSTQDDSSSFRAPNQSQDPRQPSTLGQGIPSLMETPPDEQTPVADQNQQIAEQMRNLPARSMRRPVKRLCDAAAESARMQQTGPAPVVTKTPASKMLSTMQTCTQSNNSMITFKADPIHFNDLPELHSLDWQLQYPAGGSTHAAYPYPNLDPRLVFHDGLIPLNNGLPEISQVPKLVLPIGWTHITWSGLLPVAFDPYRQAFKLTPVGPLPLTSEELHQNGLHKYVPGGERHPETPHLPKMMEFSDGSDENVYNWEGVDWTLPWTEMNQTLELLNNTSQGTAMDEAVALVSGDGRPGITMTTPSHYNEVRDCPDGIVDLTEAWRWLRKKELKQTLIFVPTAGKTWRGTGIHRASRKVKQPIPGLMALTIANAAENPEMYLVNQDRRDFCPFRSVATPVHANITLLGETEFTLQELLSYFPTHFFWRKGADRLCYAGLSAGDIANMINMTRCLSDDAARRAGTVGDRLRHETSEDGTRIKIERSTEDQTMGLTAQGWTYEGWELTDYPLLALTHGLLSVPEGEDAGPLTKLIIWCRNQGRYEVLLSHIPALLNEAGIDKKIERVTEEYPDKRMLVRHMDALKEDRKRVLEWERRKKRMAESKEDGRGKKKRTE